MSRKVPVQKGSIVADQMISKHMPRSEKTREDIEHNALRRSGQSLTLHEPKSRSK